MMLQRRKRSSRLGPARRGGSAGSDSCAAVRDRRHGTDATPLMPEVAEGVAVRWADADGLMVGGHRR